MSNEFGMSHDDDDDIVDTPEARGDFVAKDPEPAPKVEVPAPETAPKAEEPVPEPVVEATEPVVTAEVPAPEPEKTVNEPIRVPKDRLDAEIAKRRALERKLAELEAAQNTPANPLEGINLEKNIAAALDQALAGDINTASGQLSQVFAEAVQAALTEARKGTENLTQKTREELEFDATVAKFESEYSFFNPEAPDFDETAVSEAIELRDFYVAKGYTLSEALKKAVPLVVNAKPELAPKPSQPPTPTRPVAPATKVAEKVAAANAQPPKMPAAVREPESLDIRSLTDEDLDRLSEAEIRRLRGDFT